MSGTSGKQNGKVKFFNQKKGFGFITKADDNKDIFVHVSGVKSAVPLKDNDEVTFEITDGKRGDQAINVYHKR